jgi:hypothetical protein
MSLREQLKRAVASCVPLPAQLATFAANDATANATPAQQPPGNPRQIRSCGATGNATSAQPGLKTCATFTPSEPPQSCAAVASELTAHRVMKKLLEAAMRACDHHGDGAEAREEMKRQCLETPPHLRADLLAHFQREYPE